VKRSTPTPASQQLIAQDRALALAHAPAGLFDRHFRRLRELPAHGNTKLFADQLVCGLLLSFFDPLARSLRLIEGCTDFGGQLDLPRLARSTTSDALAAFDPEHLLPLVQDLRERCPQLCHADADLEGITRRIIAADGTYLTTLADVAWALHHTKINGRTQGQVRANVQLDVANWAPQVVNISGDDEESEPAAFAKDLLCGVLYVVDRNFVDFAFIRAVLDKDNDLVLRVRGNAPAVRVIQSLPLTARDIEAGVIADELVELTGRDAPAGIFRRVTLLTTDRSGKPQTIRLLSNLIDSTTVAAHVIGAAYKLRWQIELFFKWLKCFARMDHLLSTSRNGITTQLYIAVIAVLLMCVQTGRRVSIYALHALSRVASGQMSLQQAMQVIARRERERQLNRARQARLRARKKLA
jgi:Transposase DDE domain